MLSLLYRPGLLWIGGGGPGPWAWGCRAGPEDRIPTDVPGGDRTEPENEVVAPKRSDGRIKLPKDCTGPRSAMIGIT